jgi:hypothetical protein
VDLGKQILRESSRTDENGNGNSTEIREYWPIDRIAFHIWSFGRGGFLSAGKLSAASIFDHCQRFHSFLPKRAYKIVVDGIENHPFHLEIRR